MTMTEAPTAQCVTCGWPVHDHRRSVACPDCAQGDGHACWCIGAVFAGNVRPERPVPLPRVLKPHGTAACYQRGCDRPECRQAYLDYHRARSKKSYAERMQGRQW